MIVERRTLYVTVLTGGEVEFKLPKQKFEEGDEINERIRRCNGRPEVDNPSSYLRGGDYTIDGFVTISPTVRMVLEWSKKEK